MPRRLLPLLALCAACSPRAVAPRPTTAWPIPAGWKHETIAFPLDFAPALAHRGVEELRFPPGFLDEHAPDHFAYAFVWRLEDPAPMAAPALAAELVTYFRGLLAAVDGAQHRLDPTQIRVSAEPAAAGFALTAHLIDTFHAAAPIDLTGTATRTACGAGALWTFVLAPADAPSRPALAALAQSAACGQPVAR